MDMAALSLTLPGCEQYSVSEGIPLTKNTNNQLSEIVRRYPHKASSSVLPKRGDAIRKTY